MCKVDWTAIWTGVIAFGTFFTVFFAYRAARATERVADSDILLHIEKQLQCSEALKMRGIFYKMIDNKSASDIRTDFNLWWPPGKPRPNEDEPSQEKKNACDDFGRRFEIAALLTETKVGRLDRLLRQSAVVRKRRDIVVEEWGPVLLKGWPLLDLFIARRRKEEGRPDLWKKLEQLARDCGCTVTLKEVE